MGVKREVKGRGEEERGEGSKEQRAPTFHQHLSRSLLRSMITISDSLN